ncbi:MAG: hypothetical protein J3Q66DRAFT_396400 [Benniella sp.]|nr:MAG: hypothetical protein J3Q66DRAFT_396400 [Benniella sp.]
MTRNLSIFDIPHVMGRIGSYLDREDLLSCVLVSKAFHKEFNRLVWSNISFRHHKLYLKQNLDPDRIQAINRNIQWTRRLSIDIQCQPEVLSLLPDVCSNLRNFTIFISRKQHDDSNERLILSVIDMIDRNTRLRTCTFIRYALLSNNSLEKVTGAFSRSPCLTELNLEFRIVPPPRGWLQCVLQNLPRTLKKLTVLWIMPNETSEVEALPARNWPESYPYLEIADLLVDLARHEEQTFYQFLKRCPALKTQLPHVEDIGSEPVDGPPLCYERPYSIFYNRSDIQLVLTTCPKLKSINCFCYWLLWMPNLLQDGSNTHPGLNVITSTESDTNNDRMVDWVCLELEELKLTFADGRSASAGEPLLSQQEQQVTQGIRRVYEQIGRLEKLKKLTMGWCSTDRFAESASLNMSLQSGMGHMEKLKMLSMLDLNYIPKVNIGMEEAQWMLDHWPMLKTISGLRYRYRIVREGGDEPDYIVLLKSRRPWLELC